MKATLARHIALLAGLMLSAAIAAAEDNSSPVKPYTCLWTSPCTRAQLVSWVKEMAGAEARNCGDLQLQDDQKGARACVREALSEHKPFFIVFDMQGIDSALSVGIALMPDGTAHQLFWDSDITGGSEFHSSISRTECKALELRTEGAEGGPVRCVPAE